MPDYLTELSRIDFTTNLAYSQLYSCLGFMSLNFTVDGEQVLVCGQECADNNLLIFHLGGNIITQIKKEAIFTSFVNKAVYSQGQLWVCEQNGVINIIRLGKMNISTDFQILSLKENKNYKKNISSLKVNNNTTKRNLIDLLESCEI